MTTEVSSVSDGGSLLSTEPIKRGKNVSYLIVHREEVPGRSVLSPRMRTALRQLRARTDTVLAKNNNWTAWTASYVIVLVGVGSLADGHTVAMPDCINTSSQASDRGRWYRSTRVKPAQRVNGNK